MLNVRVIFSKICDEIYWFVYFLLTGTVVIEEVDYELKGGL